MIDLEKLDQIRQQRINQSALKPSQFSGYNYDIPIQPIIQPTPEQIRSQNINKLKAEGAPEQIVSATERASDYASSGFFGDAMARFGAGVESFDLDKDIFVATQLNDIKKVDELRSIKKRVLQIEKESRKDDTSKFLGTLAEVLGPMAESMKDSLAYGVTGAAYGLTGGPAAPATAGAGFLSGMTVGQFANWSMQGGGQIYSELRDSGIDHDTARKVALGGGLVYGLIEQITRVLPKPFQSSLTEPLKNYLTRKLTSSALQAAGRYTIGVVGETAEESLQDATTKIAYNVAANWQKGIAEDGSPLAQIATPEIIKSGIDTAKESILPIMVLGSVGGAVDINRIRSSNQTVNQLEKELKTLTPSANESDFQAMWNRSEQEQKQNRPLNVDGSEMTTMQVYQKNIRQSIDSAKQEKQQAEQDERLRVQQVNAQRDAQFKSAVDSISNAPTVITDQAINQLNAEAVKYASERGYTIDEKRPAWIQMVERVYGDDSTIAATIKANAIEDAGLEVKDRIEALAQARPESRAEIESNQKYKRQLIDEVYAKYKELGIDITKKEIRDQVDKPLTSQEIEAEILRQIDEKETGAKPVTPEVENAVPQRETTTIPVAEGAQPSTQVDQEVRQQAAPIQTQEVVNVAKQQLSEKQKEWDRINRQKRGDSWFEGANIDESARAGFDDASRSGGQNISAHGMAKERTLQGAIDNLINLFSNGIDESRGGGQLYTAPLTRAGNVGAGVGTASGGAYSNGPFILVAKKGVAGIKSMDDVAAVLVNQSHAEITDNLRTVIQNIRPDVMVEPYSNAGGVVRKINRLPAVTQEQEPQRSTITENINGEDVQRTYELINDRWHRIDPETGRKTSGPISNRKILTEIERSVAISSPKPSQVVAKINESNRGLNNPAIAESIEDTVGHTKDELENTANYILAVNSGRLNIDTMTLDDIRAAGIDPSKVVLVRITDPRIGPRAENYWSADPSWATRQMFGTERRGKPSTMITSTLERVMTKSKIQKDETDASNFGDAIKLKDENLFYDSDLGGEFEIKQEGRGFKYIKKQKDANVQPEITQEQASKISQELETRQPKPTGITPAVSAKQELLQLNRREQPLLQAQIDGRDLTSEQLQELDQIQARKAEILGQQRATKEEAAGLKEIVSPEKKQEEPIKFARGTLDRVDEILASNPSDEFAAVKSQLAGDDNYIRQAIDSAKKRKEAAKKQAEQKPPEEQPPESGQIVPTKPTEPTQPVSGAEIAPVEKPETTAIQPAAKSIVIRDRRGVDQQYTEGEQVTNEDGTVGKIQIPEQKTKRGKNQAIVVNDAGQQIGVVSGGRGVWKTTAQKLAEDQKKQEIVARIQNAETDPELKDLIPIGEESKPLNPLSKAIGVSIRDLRPLLREAGFSARDDAGVFTRGGTVSAERAAQEGVTTGTMGETVDTTKEGVSEELPSDTAEKADAIRAFAKYKALREKGMRKSQKEFQEQGRIAEELKDQITPAELARYDKMTVAQLMREADAIVQAKTGVTTTTKAEQVAKTEEQVQEQNQIGISPSIATAKKEKKLNAVQIINEEIDKRMKELDSILKESQGGKITKEKTSRAQYIASELQELRYLKEEALSKRAPIGERFQTYTVSDDKPTDKSYIINWAKELSSIIPNSTFVENKTNSDTAGTLRVGEKTIELVMVDDITTSTGEKARGRITVGVASDYRIEISKKDGRISTPRHEFGHIIFDSLTGQQKQAISAVLGYDISTTIGQERFVIENLESDKSREALVNKIMAAGTDQRGIVIKAINQVIRIFNAVFKTNIAQIGKTPDISTITAKELSDGLKNFSIALQQPVSGQMTDRNMFVRNTYLRNKTVTENKLIEAMRIIADEISKYTKKQYTSSLDLPDGVTSASASQEIPDLGFSKEKNLAILERAWEKAGRATGWWKITASEPFMFEIDSSGLRFKPNANIAKLDKASSMELGLSGDLVEMIDFPEFFNLYPMMKRWKLNLYKDNSSNDLGLVNLLDKEINVNLRDGYDPASTIVHELQHTVQEAEGFGMGSSPLIEKIRKKQRLNYLASEIDKIYDQQLNQWKNIPSFINAPFSEKQSIIKFGSETLQKLTKEFDELLAQEPFDLYQKMSGEIFSRLAERRRRRSAKERQEITPRDDMIMMLQGEYYLGFTNTGPLQYPESVANVIRSRGVPIDEFFAQLKSSASNKQIVYNERFQKVEPKISQQKNEWTKSYDEFEQEFRDGSDWKGEAGKEFIKFHRARTNKSQTLRGSYQQAVDSGMFDKMAIAQRLEKSVAEYHKGKDIPAEEARGGVFGRIKAFGRSLIQSHAMSIKTMAYSASPELGKWLDENIKTHVSETYKNQAYEMLDKIVSGKKELLTDKDREEAAKLTNQLIDRIKTADMIKTNIGGLFENIDMSKEQYFMLLRTLLDEDGRRGAYRWLNINEQRYDKKSDISWDVFNKKAQEFAISEIDKDSDFKTLSTASDRINSSMFPILNDAYKAIIPREKWPTETGLEKVEFYTQIHRDMPLNVDQKNRNRLIMLFKDRDNIKERKGSERGIIISDGIYDVFDTVNKVSAFAANAKFTTDLRSMLRMELGDGEITSLGRSIIKAKGRQFFDNFLESLDQVEGTAYNLNNTEDKLVNKMMRWISRGALTGPTTAAMQLTSFFVPLAKYDASIVLEGYGSAGKVTRDFLLDKARKSLDGGALLTRLAHSLPYEEARRSPYRAGQSKFATFYQKGIDAIDRVGFFVTKQIDRETVFSHGRVAWASVEKDMPTASAQEKDAEFIRRWNDLLQYQMMGDPSMKVLSHNRGGWGPILNMFRTTVNAQYLKFSESYLKAKASNNPQDMREFIGRGAMTAMTMVLYTTAVRLGAEAAKDMFVEAFGDDDDKKELQKKKKYVEDNRLAVASKELITNLAGNFPITTVGSLLVDYVSEVAILDRKDRERNLGQAAIRLHPFTSGLDALLKWGLSSQRLAKSYSEYESVQNRKNLEELNSAKRDFYKSTLNFSRYTPMSTPLPVWSNFLALDKALFNIGD